MIDPQWRRRLADRAEQPPVRERVPLRLRRAAVEVGSVEPALALALQAAGLPVQVDATGCVLEGDADRTLADIARWLHERALASRWRDELLAVTGAEGHVHAAIERAAVRPLGIATHAVHLIGHAPGGDVWLQQRALDKATDPGLWDTLVGGLCAAGESRELTLERETWEEAGLRLPELAGLRHVGRLKVRRPVAEGYMVEHIDSFAAHVPASLQPQNQDGEVAGFACVPRGELVERLEADVFTLEAALVFAQWLEGGS